jgi:microcystin-dependent protein
MSDPYVGEIRMFGFSRVPAGWQACDGSLLPISQYEVLYMLLSTTYGGDGVNTFGVPDLRGRVPVEQGQGAGLTARVLGQVTGTETVTLSSGQLPAHTHFCTATTDAGTTATPGSSVTFGAIVADTMYTSDITGLTAYTLANASIGAQGGSQPHNNLMPTLSVPFCIATVGIFPSQF